MYSWLVLINSLGSVLLLGLVGANVYWLLKQLKRKAAVQSPLHGVCFTLLSLAGHHRVPLLHAVPQQSIDVGSTFASTRP